MKRESPFREVQIAADYLRNMAQLLGFELDSFKFEEFDRLEGGTFRISFSYETNKCFTVSPSQNTTYKTLYVKDGEVTAVRTGTLAAQDITKLG